MTYFDQIDPINDIFDQNYVHKPDRYNFSNLEVKIFFTDIMIVAPLKP